MLRLALAMTALVACCTLGTEMASAQATKNIEGKEAAAQQNSWQQVDQINKEADQTRARHSQGLQSGGITKGHTGGYILKKSYPSKRSPKMKAAPNQRKAAAQAKAKANKTKKKK